MSATFFKVCIPLQHVKYISIFQGKQAINYKTNDVHKQKSAESGVPGRRNYRSGDGTPYRAQLGGGGHRGSGEGLPRCSQG